MHNLHYVRTYAQDPKEACELVENELSDWGDENNWRTICGCIDQEGNAFEYDTDGRYSSKEATTNSINDTINHFLNNSPELYKEAFEKVVADPQQATGMDWFCARQYCKTMEDIAEAKPANGQLFDCWKDTFRQEQYSEFGLTEINAVKEEGEKLYIVLIDMHS